MHILGEGLEVDFDHLEGRDKELLTEVTSILSTYYPYGLGVDSWTLRRQEELLKDPNGRTVFSGLVLLGVVPSIPPNCPYRVKDGSNFRGLNLSLWTLQGRTTSTDFRDCIPPKLTNSFLGVDCIFSLLTFSLWEEALSVGGRQLENPRIVP